jgi:hypothetical protein
VYRINDLVEKPSAAEAPSDLAIIGRYILTPTSSRPWPRRPRDGRGRDPAHERPAHAEGPAARCTATGSRACATTRQQAGLPEGDGGVRAQARDLGGPVPRVLEGAEALRALAPAVLGRLVCRGRRRGLVADDDPESFAPSTCHLPTSRLRIWRPRIWRPRTCRLPISSCPISRSALSTSRRCRSSVLARVVVMYQPVPLNWMAGAERSFWTSDPQVGHFVTVSSENLRISSNRPHLGHWYS